MGSWWCERVPGSQQQRQAVVAELLVEALGAGGGGIHQAGVGGAPLARDEPGVPRQQRLKLWRSRQEVVIAKRQRPPLIAIVAAVVVVVVLSDLCSTWGRSASGPPRP